MVNFFTDHAMYHALHERCALPGSTFNLTPIHDMKYLFIRMIVSYELGTLAIELSLPNMRIPYNSTWHKL